VPALSVERLTVLVYASLAACAVLLLAVVTLSVRLSRIRRGHARLLRGAPSDDLLAVVSRQVDTAEQLQRELRVIGRETAELRERVAGAVRGVGFTRYDAFPDIGGQLSFSAAFLDGAGDGMVLSIITGRSDSRSYAKAIRRGRSEHQLSEEEQAAIAMAMGQPRPVARSSA
jgi:Protein of unknown function (DUF4446)